MAFLFCRNDRIWKGDYKDELGPFDVGKTYWYQCRIGVFEFTDGHQESYMNLTCINDPYQSALRAEPPHWDPPYDHFLHPFPKCVRQCKYWPRGKYSLYFTPGSEEN